jgi:GxxExxY protein
MLHSDVSGKIIACAMAVHGSLGNGFQELVYHRALEIELRHAGLRFESEKEMHVYYRGERIAGRRVDFWVENCMTVEIKAVAKLENVHLAQAMNYLEAYQLKTGLLINFGARSLEFRRVYNNKLS